MKIDHTTMKWLSCTRKSKFTLAKFLCILQLLLWPLTFQMELAAQSHSRSFGKPGITNISRNTYEGGTQNWSIGQDARGLMYFGNNKGLLRYDGEEWFLQSMPNHTIVRSFAFGDNGVIYVGAQRELGYIASTENGLQEYRSLVSLMPEDKREFEDVWRVFLTDQGVLFCTEKALYLYRQDQFEVIQPPGSRFENFFELKGEVWVQDKDEGLFRFTGTQFEQINGSVAISNDRVVAVLPMAQDSNIVITSGLGIWISDAQGLGPWEVELSEYAKIHKAYCALRLSDGRIALGTAQHGLALAGEEGSLHTSITSQTGLINNTILSIYEDAQSNVWCGLDNGLAYIDLKSPFSFIQKESQVYGTGYAVSQYGDDIYLGTNQGLYRSPWPPLAPDRAAFEFIQGSEGQVWSLDQVSNTLIVSRHDGAYELRENRLQPISGIRGSWKFMELARHPGFALQGTYTGLALYRKSSTDQGARWIFVKRLEGFDESARVMEEDSDGHIWISHAYKGLYKLALDMGRDVEKGRDCQIKDLVRFGKEDGLPSDLFIHVAKILNEIVFTTPQGIFRYNRLAGNFDPYEAYEEILGPEENVHRLIEDAAGNIWFSINRDFGMIPTGKAANPEERELRYFNQLQNQLVDGFEHVYAVDEHNVFVGTEKGFVHFDPNIRSSHFFPFEALISRVSTIAGLDSVLYWGVGASPDVPAPDLHHRLNGFRFEFTAPYYAHNEQLLYRYKLEGFEDTWSEWSRRKEKEYTNLSHGSYTFKIQARNAFANESAVASFSFRVLPPWWASNYAKVAYFLLAVLALILLIRFVKLREKRKTEAFKLEQRQKLQEKEAEFKREVAKSENEVITLRNEKLLADVNHKTSQLASATMHLVQKTEMLHKLKTDLTKLNDQLPAGVKREVKQITRDIERDMQLDNSWEQFEVYFDQVHENFFKRLRSKYPELTPKDQKLCAYLRMNLSTKEIAPLLNISVRGVEISRYRLRKKLKLDSDTNLVEFIMDV